MRLTIFKTLMERVTLLVELSSLGTGQTYSKQGITQLKVTKIDFWPKTQKSGAAHASQTNWFKCPCSARDNSEQDLHDHCIEKYKTNKSIGNNSCKRPRLGPGDYAANNYETGFKIREKYFVDCSGSDELKSIYDKRMITLKTREGQCYCANNLALSRSL